MLKETQTDKAFHWYYSEDYHLHHHHYFDPNTHQKNNDDSAFNIKNLTNNYRHFINIKFVHSKIFRCVMKNITPSVNHFLWEK